VKNDQEPGKPMKRLSIKTIISVIAGVATIMTVIYITYLSHRKFEETVISQTQQELLTIGKATALGLEDFVAERFKALKTVSRNPLFQKAVYEKRACDIPETTFCPLRNLYEVNDQVTDALTLLDANGIMLHREPFIADRVGMDHTDKPGVAYVMREQKPHVSEVFYNNLGKLAISISEPIFYNEAFAGIVRWMIEIGTIGGHFVEPIKVGEKGYAWMFDDRNVVLSHPRKDFVGMSVLAVIRNMHRERGEVFDESRVEEHIREEHDYLNRVKAEEESSGIFVNCVTDENDIVGLKRVSLDEATFDLIITLPYSEIVGPVRLHARNIFGLACLVILLLSAAGLGFLRSEKRKTELETETKYLKQIANGAEALQQSEERFRQMAENINEVFWMSEPKSSKILYVSPAYESIWQSPVEALYEDPRKWMEYIHKDDLEIVISNWKEQIKGHPTYEEFRIILPDGSIRWIANQAYPIENDKGQVTRVTGVAGDITDRKQAVKERMKVEAQLQEVQRMEAIATLAGGIAHEFNNALVGVSGNIELLDMDLPDDEKMDRYVGQMKDSTRRMANLTDQLLAYARGGKYQPKAISLNSFVEGTLPLLRHSIDPAIRVETDLPRDVSHIEADLTQMQMVLSALLSNSAEAMEGEGRIRIITRDEKIEKEIAKTESDLKPGSYVSLTIQDDGRGMDEETISRVFDPFFTTKFQGRGMGMAAAYGIIKNHGGAISVDSELGKGTAVRIYLPAVAVHVEHEKETKTEVAAGTGTILVIEDEDVVIDVISRMLEMLGYRMLLAKSGKAAVDIARGYDGDIDLAILDIVLPDMGGKQVYPLVMEARPSLKVIVCSGYAVDGPAQEILNAGAQDFIQKPFSFETLSEKLKEVLRGQIHH
jgi:PAS domain S-box-containing protein